MSEGQRSTLLAYLRRLVGAATDSSDAELLERFAAQRDEAAFEALLRRHGPLVWSVCRRVLAEEHAAEDAFQATFLVLVRKARSVSKQASIRSWLHGVALRVALRARQQESLRRRREQETPIRPPGEATWQEVRPILDEEIQRLPEKYRLPIILCYLEGQTNDEAARLLNCPRGTVATRLARARERLRSSLLRRGVSLSAGTLATYLTDNAMSAAVPSLLLAQTAKVALMGAASVSITTLTEGVLHAMFLSKIKMASSFVLVLAAIGGAEAGAYYLRAQAPAEQVPAPPLAEPLPPQKFGVPGQEITKEQELQKEADELLKKLNEAMTDKKSAGTLEDLFQKLLRARRDMAEQAFRFRYELYRTGANEPGTSNSVTLHMLIDASNCLLKAELELSKKKAERLEAYEKHLKFMKEIAKITEAQYRVGRVSRAALASALYEQLYAEIELEREKAR
jgi:RNA polymerase sigma factor (sigma-70 family)